MGERKKISSKKTDLSEAKLPKMYREELWPGRKIEGKEGAERWP